MKTSRTVRIASAIASFPADARVANHCGLCPGPEDQGQHHQSRWKHHDHDNLGWLESRCRADRQHRRAAGAGRLQGPQEGNVHGGPDSRPYLRGARQLQRSKPARRDWVRFNGEDLEQAQSAQAAVHETQVQSANNQAELKQQADALAAQNAALKEQQAAIDKQQQEIAANKAKIAANSARFGQLDDYYILDEVTVLLRQRPDQGRSRNTTPPCWRWCRRP